MSTNQTMTNPARLQRDAMIDVVFEAATKDRNVYLISADFGAAALDRFREKLGKQFIHSGISEQHMIDMAAGLSLAGKRVYCYAMAPFITLRCLEQIKCALALMDRPVTVIASGVGLGYADSGPTHYTTEDIACLRSLVGVEVWTPADEVAAVAFTRRTLEQPAFRIVRLDREALPIVYGDVGDKRASQGMVELASGSDICIVSSGYMLHRVLKAAKALCDGGQRVGVVDLACVKPLDLDALKVLTGKYKAFLTVEEQCLAGGFGSAFVEALADLGIQKRVRRMGLPDRYVFENGGRSYLLDRSKLAVDDVISAAKTLAQVS